MKVIMIVLMYLFSLTALANQQLETIQLNHRLANEVLSEIHPFLPKGATARAYNELIIIKADSKTIKEIKHLINKLDTPPQRLKVSVLVTDEDLSKHQIEQFSAGIDISDEDRYGSGSIKRWSTNKSQNKEHTYQAQGMAGKPIFINLGQDIAQQERYLYFNRYGGVSTQQTTSYISLKNGFQAVANILPNNQVIVEIHPEFSSFNPRNGTINSSNVISTVSGAAGSWLELGQVDNEKSLEKQGSTSYHTHRQQQQSIYIKVEQQ